MPGLKKGSKFKHKWDDDTMMAALNEVKIRKLSIRTAASKYNIPLKTVWDYVMGRSAIGICPGRKSVLKSEEEQAVLGWCLHMNRIGYGRTRRKSSLPL